MPGFFEKIFGSKKTEISEGVVTLPELRLWCEDEIGKHEKDALKDLESKAKKISGLSKEAEEIIEELNDFEIPKDIKKRVYKPALTHRPTYIRGMREALSSISQPESSMEGLEKFHTNLSNTLKSIQKIQFGQGRYLAFVFREQMFGLGGALNKIIDINKEYEEVLEEFKSDTQEVQKVREGLESLEGDLKKIGIYKNEIKDIKSSLKELDIKSGELQTELEKLTKSSKYKKYLKAKVAFQERQERGQVIESQILNMLRPMARAFRKYKKYQEGTGAADPIIEEYLNDPVTTFLNEETDCPKLKKIIRGVEQASQDGGATFSEKELKTIKIDWKFLTGLREKAMESKTTEEIDESPEKERENLTHQIEKTSDEKDRLIHSLAEKNEEIKESKKSIPEKKDKLEEELLEIKEGDYSIELPSA